MESSSITKNSVTPRMPRLPCPSAWRAVEARSLVALEDGVRRFIRSRSRSARPLPGGSFRGHLRGWQHRRRSRRACTERHVCPSNRGPTPHHHRCLCVAARPSPLQLGCCSMWRPPPIAMATAGGLPVRAPRNLAEFAWHAMRNARGCGARARAAWRWGSVRTASARTDRPASRGESA